MFVEKLSNLDETCKFQSTRIMRKIVGDQLKLYRYIDDYLKAYCEFYDLNYAEVLRIRYKFSQRYIKDLGNFEKYGKYPHQLECEQFTLTRIEYDVVLILSFLLEKHRFEIALWLANQQYEGKILMIGIGPGVELGIIKEYLGCSVSLIGFDLDLSGYVLEKYRGIVSQECFYPGDERFDMVLLIEIIEHLMSPVVLLKDALSVLNKNGRILLTTAIDVPQFDHLCNFQPKQIFKMLGGHEMICEEFITCEHKMNASDILSKNELVVARRAAKK